MEFVMGVEAQDERIVGDASAARVQIGDALAVEIDRDGLANRSQSASLISVPSGRNQEMSGMCSVSRRRTGRPSKNRCGGTPDARHAGRRPCG